MNFNSDGTIKEELQPRVQYNPKTGCTARMLVQKLPTRTFKLTKTQRKAMKATQKEQWQKTNKSLAMAQGYKNIMALLSRGCPVRMA